tara:strand:- start:69 stop:440 length:372 start_codon:yes stop_codon:yes gene_type:complete
MRLTKRQLKRIIREEYSRLKRRGLIREGRIGYDEEEGNIPRGATDLMDIAKDAFSYGDGDGIIMHWMQTLGVAAHETGEVDEEDFMAIQQYESQFNPNVYDEGLMRQLMMNLSQDAVDLLYGG